MAAEAPKPQRTSKLKKRAREGEDGEQDDGRGRKRTTDQDGRAQETADKDAVDSERKDSPNRVNALKKGAGVIARSLSPQPDRHIPYDMRSFYDKQLSGYQDVSAQYKAKAKYFGRKGCTLEEGVAKRSLEVVYGCLKDPMEECKAALMLFDRALHSYDEKDKLETRRELRKQRNQAIEVLGTLYTHNIALKIEDVKERLQNLENDYPQRIPKDRLRAKL